MTTTGPEYLMARLVAAFPTAHLPEPTVVLWIERIEQESSVVAAAAIAEVIETWPRTDFPPISAFARAAAERREAFAQRGHPTLELEGASCDPERHQRVVQLRDVLAAAVPPAPKPQPSPTPPPRERADTEHDDEPGEAQC
jgi:hypothetical protein